MSYSTYALHCNSCETINEPINKTRQHDGSVKASYRCDCGTTFQQKFNLNFEIPKLEPPEEKEEKKLPKPPTTEVMQWTKEERNEYLEAYGEEAYKSLVAKHFKDGEAFAEAPQDESMEIVYPDPNKPPKEWTKLETSNFIDKFGRDEYQKRYARQYATKESD